MREDGEGYVTLECPNTVFYIFIQNEVEGAKLEIFMNNIRFMNQLKLNDIYNWCNNQKISYETHFKYNRRIPLWRNMKAYLNYYKQKTKYQPGYQPV